MVAAVAILILSKTHQSFIVNENYMISVLKNWWYNVFLLTLKIKNGVSIAISLPENDHGGICNKLFNDLTLSNMIIDTGVTTLITYFNGLFLSDEQSEVHECYIEFDYYAKESNMKLKIMC